MAAIIESAPPGPALSVVPGETNRGPFLEAADRIGLMLCRDALWAGDRCNWVGWSMEPVGRGFSTCFRAMPPALYNGLAGIAVFLAQLTRRTQDSHQRKCLSGAMRQLAAGMDSLETPATLGYFAGLTGVACTLVQVGELTGDTGWVELGLHRLEKAGPMNWEPASFDVISGYAGTIPVLIDLARRFDRPALIEIARNQAGALLKARQEDASGVSWPSAMTQKKNLTGYSHGAAGIGLALLELHRAAPDPDLFNAGMGALRYERNCYDKSVENWPDYRIDPTASAYNPSTLPGYSATWCNGSTGIGCSRLRVLELVPEDGEALPEVDSAMRTAVRTLHLAQLQPGSDLTFCHGQAGSADLLLLIADQFQRPDLRTLAEQAGHTAIETLQKPGLPWPCGVPGAGETPGLMLGTAGIGYFFLRLLDSQSIPSVLLVRPHLNGPVRRHDPDAPAVEAINPAGTETPAGQTAEGIITIKSTVESPS